MWFGKSEGRGESIALSSLRVRGAVPSSQATVTTLRTSDLDFGQGLGPEHPDMGLWSQAMGRMSERLVGSPLAAGRSERVEKLGANA